MEIKNCAMPSHVDYQSGIQLEAQYDVDIEVDNFTSQPYFILNFDSWHFACSLKAFSVLKTLPHFSHGCCS